MDSQLVGSSSVLTGALSSMPLLRLRANITPTSGSFPGFSLKGLLLYCDRFQIDHRGFGALSGMLTSLDEA